MNSLYFLIGLPRSGKTLIGQEWLNYEIDIDNNNMVYTSHNKLSRPPRVVVCADDIRLSMGHRWNGFIESYVHATKMTMIRTLLYKHDVLVDGTHTTTSSIQELLNIDHLAQYLFVNTNPELCLERAKTTGQEDLIPVINRMNNQLWKLADKTNISPYLHLSEAFIANIDTTINKLRQKVANPKIV